MRALAPRLLAKAVRDGIAADRDRLVLWLPACLGAGISLYFALRFEPSPWWGLLICCASGLALLLNRRSRVLQALCAALFCAGAGFSAAAIDGRMLPPMVSLPRTAALLSGQVVAVDLLADGRRRVLVSPVSVTPAPRPADAARAAIAEAPPLSSRRAIRVRLRPDDTGVLFPGDLVRIRAMLRPPAAPDWPGGRDPQRDAFFSGTAGSGSALAPVTLLSRGAGRGAGVATRRFREAVAARIEGVLPGASGAVAATLLTGLGTSIPQADRDAFAASGLAHLLAVAGLHLGIVMGLVLSITRMVIAAWEWGALRLPGRQIAALVALVAGALYMLLTGLHLPGLRALAMAAVAMLGMMIGRQAVSMRALCFAASMLLLFDPALLLDIAFQMSFAAVLALLAGYEAARPLIGRLQGPRLRDRIGLHLFQLFFTSLVAGSASLPFAAFHFGRVQFYFVLANLFAVPLTAFWVMPQGLLALLAMPLGLDWPFERAMGAGIDLILLLARTVAALPAASLPIPAAPTAGLLLNAFGLLFLCLWRRTWRLLGLLPIVLGCASPWLIASPDLLVSDDARLIVLRGGPGMLIEQGNRADPVTLSDWRRGWAVSAAAVAFPEAGAVDGAGNVTCNPVACLITRRSRTVMLLRAPLGGNRDEDDDADDAGALQQGDCDGVSLLLSPATSRGACHGVPRVDRFTVWRDGPQAVWMRRNGVTVRGVAGNRGDRPWVPRRGFIQRRPTLPLAPAE